jgi:hypothetical protein
MLYCPTCRGEFVDGIDRCKKCNCNLVAYEELLPICPECNKTFPFGTKKCPACHIRTITTNFDDDDAPPADSELHYVELVTVYEAANEGELAIVKGLLEANGIQFYAKGESIVAIEGLGSIGGFNPLFGPICVQVAPDKVEEAKVVLSDFIGK